MPTILIKKFMSKVSKVLSKELRGNLVVVMGVLIAGLMVVSGCSSQEAVAPGMEKTGSNKVTERENVYKDGLYDFVGSYTSPAGPEEIQINIVLADGLVSFAKAFPKAENATSQKMQNLFIAGFEKEVVGKYIDDVELDVVNGSSLTPKGFMNALEKVKMEAKKAA